MAGARPPNAQPTKAKPSLADLQQWPDHRHGDRRGLEPLEPEHRIDPWFHTPMVLLDGDRNLASAGRALSIFISRTA